MSAPSVCERTESVPVGSKYIYQIIPETLVCMSGVHDSDVANIHIH